jgi:predicted TIM-barrel fold metal-dependent hydrolase
MNQSSTLRSFTRRSFIGALAAAPLASLAQGNSYRIIDPHVHVWKRSPEFPFSKDSYKKPPTFDATPEMLLGLMKENGVSRTVIIQSVNYLWDNSFLASVLKQYPTYFKGVARVNPASLDAPDDLSKLVEEQGFSGVRLNPYGTSGAAWIKNVPLMLPLWKRCYDLKVPMTVLALINQMRDVEILIQQFPELTVVIDHMADCPLGHPDLLAKLTALEKYPNVFVKISHTWELSKQPYPFPDAQEQVKAIYDVFGPKRLMWGTDWPNVLEYCGYAKALTLVRDDMKFLNADDKHWMLNRTIERVWPFS